MTSLLRHTKSFDSIDSIASMMDGDELRDVPCDLIDEDPDQPRQTWDTPRAVQEYEATRNSIRSKGVRQPVTLRPSTTAGRFFLITGANRLRGSRELGLPTIPAVVRQNITLEEVRLDQLIENVRRYDLNPLDFALAVQARLDDGMSRSKIIEALGCKEQWLSKRLSILRLPDDVQTFAREDVVRDIDTLSALSKMDPADRHLQIQALRDGNVDGEAVRKAASKKSKRKKKRVADPNIKALLTTMQEQFGARVALDYNEKTKKGSVSFKFNSLEELDGLLQKWNVSVNDQADD